ncbi:MAG TPA: coenzyme F420 hydrogenase [Thermococcus paralvinellae]|uniref:Coenzyme F420 hydrogenase n=2 Tax=Thermococcus paralvinellae TaxID=582419 RepID=A0A832ZAW9_9EURY|nr:coenzyme F420 hydrogenase [Thermococcus paralvinellae]
MGEYLQINELCRVAGEAKLILHHENGEVKKANFIAIAPVRGFEKLVIGKNPLFAVEAVMRICGLCHSSHGNATAEAIENALGILPPRNGLLIREALGLINRIQSHILQLVMIAGDIITEEKRMEVIFKLMTLHGKISDYLLKLGGAATHPPYLTVGGLLKVPKWSVFNNLKARLPELKSLWAEIMPYLVDEGYLTDIAMELKEKRFTPEYLASHMFYGDEYNVSPDAVKIVNYWDYKGENDETAKEATTQVAFYKGKAVEVGPRARMAVYRSFRDDSLFGIHLARVEEITIALERLEEILDQVNMNEPFRTQNIIFGPGKGVGVYEAPRGTLFHYVELGEEGRIQNFKIVVPTMFNIPIMEEAAVGLSIQAAEAVMRLYDPCIPCTTHVVELR